MAEQPTTRAIDLFRKQAITTTGVNESVLEEAQDLLKQRFPAELKEMLLLSDGVKSSDGNSLLWSTAEILEKNLFVRNDKEIRRKYMPLDDFLFFADAPCNGFFGYPITPKSDMRPWIFQWNGITDARKTSTAHDLDELFKWLLVDSERAQIFMSRMNDIYGWEISKPEVERLRAKMQEEDWEIFEPANADEIAAVESRLGMSLPDSLKRVYRFSNGLNSQIGFRIFPVEDLLAKDAIIKAEHLESNWVMPADSFLFFAPEGNGDYFGFPVTDSGIGESVMVLDHETDGRDYFASEIVGLLYCQLELDEDDE